MLIRINLYAFCEYSIKCILLIYFINVLELQVYINKTKIKKGKILMNNKLIIDLEDFLESNKTFIAIDDFNFIKVSPNKNIVCIYKQRHFSSDNVGKLSLSDDLQLEGIYDVKKNEFYSKGLGYLKPHNYLGFDIHFGSIVYAGCSLKNKICNEVTNELQMIMDALLKDWINEYYLEYNYDFYDNKVIEAYITNQTIQPYNAKSFIGFLKDCKYEKIFGYDLWDEYNYICDPDYITNVINNIYDDKYSITIPDMCGDVCFRQYIAYSAQENAWQIKQLNKLNCDPNNEYAKRRLLYNLLSDYNDNNVKITLRIDADEVTFRYPASNFRKCLLEDSDLSRWDITARSERPGFDIFMNAHRDYFGVVNNLNKVIDSISTITFGRKTIYKKEVE